MNDTTGSKMEGTPDDVVTVIRERDRERYPVIPTSAIAEELPVTKRTVTNRLQGLEAAERVESVQVGKSKFWYLPGERVISPDTELGQEIASDGALPANELEKVDELLDTQNKMYEDLRRFRAEYSKRDRWAAGAIIPTLIAMLLATFAQYAPGIPYILETSGLLLMVALFAGAVWVFKRYIKPGPDAHTED